MSYQGGDDPQLLKDLSTALKRWQRPTLGEAPLASRLAGVQRFRSANPRLTQAAALRETIRVALAWMRDHDQGRDADLLEQRYLRDQSVYYLQETYHLGERSLYSRLREARMALADALWTMEQREGEAAPPVLAPFEPSPAQRRARHLPPPTYTVLFGAEQTLVQLLNWLQDPVEHWLISLDGMGGLGKTALAREAAGRLAPSDRFAGIAWLAVRPEFSSPHGAQPPDYPYLTCDQVLDAIGSQLGDLDLSLLPTPAKRDRVRALLRAAPYLVVVDNLETTSRFACGELAGLLWELANPCKFLLTSRHHLELEIYPSSVLTVQELAEPESLDFIRHEGRLAGLPEVAAASRDTLRAILEVTGGNPLAIKLVVGQLLSLPLRRVLASLEAVKPGSEAFYEYLYCASWELLSAPAKELLRRIALLPGGGGTWEELAVNTALSEEELSAAIAELVTHSLLQAAGLEEKSYTIHPLTRHFVLNQSAEPAKAGQDIAPARG